MEQATVQTNRRLERGDGPLGGVAAGMADYFNIDPTIVRLGLVATTLLGGPTIPIAYLAAWIIIPDGRDGSPATPVAPASQWSATPPPPPPAPTPPAPVPPAPAHPDAPSPATEDGSTIHSLAVAPSDDAASPALPETDANIGDDLETETETGPVAGAGTEAEADAGPDADHTDTGPEADAHADTDTDGAETDAEADEDRS